MNRRYFIAGFYWENESQKERFIKEHIWENGYDDKYQEVYNNIRIGDFIALKSTYVKDDKSWLRIYVIGEVTGISSSRMKLNVKWEQPLQKDITDITWYAKTLYQITDEKTINKIFNVNQIKECAIEYHLQLLSNHNLILTGAPGTGKTYLAQQIAQQMIFGSVKEEKDFTPDEKKQFEEQCAFVQFHPSYDYTDFVEGLRPIQDDSGNVGFERRDGAFKEFCKKALKCNKSGAADNFDEVWDKLVEKLNNETVIDVPMLSGNNIIKLELNVTGTGLAERTYEDQSQVGQKTWIVGQSKFFSKEQLYRIYKGGKGVPSGGHDNYRKAIVKYMIENFGLVQYKEGAFIQEETHRNFVFIIDEINRGEISKIFGELFFSIDPGYRGKNLKVKTQYQNLIDEDDDFYDGFYVPENVYIIGTMNDIDRSVESMDFAMRRRFAFKEISAESRVGMIEENGMLSKFSEDIIKRMTNLNNCILTIQGLSSAYQIGAAYYLKLENYLEKGQLTELSWTNLWENHIKGLLFEYLRGTPNASVDLEEKLQPAFELKDMYEKVEGKVVKK